MRAEDVGRWGLDPEIASYYDGWPEETRLESGLGRIEAVRTREVISRFAPPAPAAVVDVGGAAGTYSFWMASLGYEVHLVEPVARLLQVARARASVGPPVASLLAGDARSLPFRDGSVDVVLLLGPLYHLVDRGERRTALAEAARVLREGGLLIAACITRWASLLDGITFDYLADPDFETCVAEAIGSGRHRNPRRDPRFFTTAYFHRPEEFVTELGDSTLETLAVLAVEGPARIFTDFEDRWADPRRREDLLRVARVLEAEPTTWGVSPHLIGVCRKGSRPRDMGPVAPS